MNEAMPHGTRRLHSQYAGLDVVWLIFTKREFRAVSTEKDVDPKDKDSRKRGVRAKILQVIAVVGIFVVYILLLIAIVNHY